VTGVPHKVKDGATLTAHVLCRDGKNRPIKGVRVKFTWGMPQGPNGDGGQTFAVVRRSNKKGIAKHRHPVSFFVFEGESETTWDLYVSATWRGQKRTRHRAIHVYRAD